MRKKLLLRLGLEISGFLIGVIMAGWLLSIIIPNFAYLTASIIAMFTAFGISVLYPHLKELLAPKPDLRIEYKDNKSFRYEFSHPISYPPKLSGVSFTFGGKTMEAKEELQTYHYIKVVNDGDGIARNCTVRMKIFDKSDEEQEPFSRLPRRYIGYESFTIGAKVDEVIDFCVDRKNEPGNIYFCSEACMEGLRRRKEGEPFTDGVYKVEVQVTADELPAPITEVFTVKKEKGYGKLTITIKFNNKEDD